MGASFSPLLHRPSVQMRTDGATRRLRLRLHGAIYRPDSIVLMLRYCVNLKEIRYESTTLNRIVAGKSHRVIVAQSNIPYSLFRGLIVLKIQKMTASKLMNQIKVLKWMNHIIMFYLREHMLLQPLVKMM